MDIACRHVEAALGPHVLDAEDSLHDERRQSGRLESLTVLVDSHSGEAEGLAFRDFIMDVTQREWVG